MKSAVTILFVLAAIVLVGPPTVGVWQTVASASSAASTEAGTGSSTQVTIDAFSGRSMGTLLRTSLAWSFGVAAAAMLLGWWPGRVLGRLLAASNRVGSRRRLTSFASLAIAVMLFAPLAIPPYAIFYVWWQVWPVGSPLHDWAVAGGHVQIARAVTLFIGLTAWSWPLAAWGTAVGAASFDSDVDRLRMLDGMSAWTRRFGAARRELPGALLGGTLVLLQVFSATTSFDLAQIWTVGNELRARAAVLPADLVLAQSGPPMIPLIAFVTFAWWLTSRARGERTAQPAPRAIGGLIVVGSLYVVSIAVPIAIFLKTLVSGVSFTTYFDLYGASLLESAWIAAAVAGIVGGLAVAAGMQWTSHSRVRRRIVDVVLLVFLIVMFVPAASVQSAFEAAWNQPGWRQDHVYRSHVIQIFVLAARGLGIGLLLMRLAVAAEPRATAMRRQLDRLGGTRLALSTFGARIPIALGAILVVTFLRSVSEAAVIAGLQPVGSDPIATRLLAALHYQRTETVVFTLGLLIITATVGAIALGGGAAGVSRFLGGRRMARTAPATRPSSTSSSTSLLIAALSSLSLINLPGCESETTDDGSIPGAVVAGGPGLKPGRYMYPRAIAADPERDRLYVIDKTARVQVLDTVGEPVGGWRMPKFDTGKPTGLSIAEDGRVFVADTHQQRVMVFSPEGEILMQFGTYGTGPGEFIYPTDVAFGPGGRLYVSEYGGNDRIQVFEADGTYVHAIGSFGDGRDQLNRPQAMVFDAARERLFVADSCNHRIVIMAPDGTVLDTIGSAGTGPGEFHYPYDVSWIDDDTLIVAEFGNERVQVIRLSDRRTLPIGTPGVEPGFLRYPWGAVRLGNDVHILDSGNDRLQRVQVSALMRRLEKGSGSTSEPDTGSNRP